MARTAAAAPTAPAPIWPARTGEKPQARGAQDDLVAVLLRARAHHAQVVVHKGLGERARGACRARPPSAPACPG